MQSIIVKALDWHEGEEIPRNTYGGPNNGIGIVGVGSAGSKIVSHLNVIGTSGAGTIAIDTDKQNLDKCLADTRIWIGKSVTKGLGAAGYPDLGRRIAISAEKTIGEILEGLDLVFLITGLGRGTGTGASPVVARIAREKGASVIGIATISFPYEWYKVFDPNPYVPPLREACDALILVDNSTVLTFAPNLPYGVLLKVTGQAICEAVLRCIAIEGTSPILSAGRNTLQALTGRRGVCSFFMAEGRRDPPAGKLVDGCLNNSLINVDFRDAQYGLFNIVGGPDLTADRAREISEEFSSRFSSSADISYSAHNDGESGDRIRLMAILGGFEWKDWVKA